MYNIDSFSYWKEPAVRIKRIGIYPLDDAGKTQYYSKNSFVHHYLKRQIPDEDLEFPFNESKKKTNEDKKVEISPKIVTNTIPNLNNLNKKEIPTNETIMKTEPNINPIKIQSPINLKNNTISYPTDNNLNKRYKLMEKNKNLNLNKANELKSYSLSKKRNIRNALFFGKSNYNTINTNKRNMTKSFDKKARLTGLQIFPNRIAKINPKLPHIMEKYRNENGNIIKFIRTGTKEMGENYNPYNFILPHVNRTKRNIFGSLFHS